MIEHDQQTRRGRSTKSPSWRWAVSDSDAHAFEIGRFRNAFLSGLRPSSRTAVRPVKHKRNQGLRGFPTEIRAAQTTCIEFVCVSIGNETTHGEG